MCVVPGGLTPYLQAGDITIYWVLRAWRDTEEATVMDSVETAGFANEPTDWLIAKHDVYGAKFRKRWSD
ncbi:Pogo transposable element with KRAB domainlike putative [Phytophthora palmivora]|uniref:Pogo transposable element with KRAB domainlike putative n=1 Tax=Phytophthora palmivora TaxID=4796 RepID=A0A2P4YMP7_9STRA|nr:Pogo transposable element with KRAB domainlike putative [Phytophthora palmivora]